MRTHDLVAAVRESCGIDTDEHALRAAGATVVVLGRRSAEVGRLLVDHLQEPMRSRLTLGRQEVFSLGSFYARVSVVEGPGCSSRDVQRHVRATVTALNRCTAGQLGLLIRALPPEYVDLLVEVPVHRSVRDDARRTARPAPPSVPTQRRSPDGEV